MLEIRKGEMEVSQKAKLAINVCEQQSYLSVSLKFLQQFVDQMKIPFPSARDAWDFINFLTEDWEAKVFS